jgi:hypothetical protein
VLVDGAHSVGALQELKVPDLGCAYFVSTLHKWLCTPKVGLVGHPPRSWECWAGLFLRCQGKIYVMFSVSK